MSNQNTYDCIVVGAGHAGTEAALAVARCGYRTLLITMNVDSICQMSCNPAIGGIAKGHMVREIDALGGQMALTTDATGIQFRMLNRSKGPAVWAPRAQCDKKQYQMLMKKVVESEPRLGLKQDQAVGLIVENKKAVGITTQLGATYRGKIIILTTGTFMQGLIHIGDVHFPGGRGGDPPSVGLSASLRENGIETARFKTGTPPRLRESTIDFSVCEEQPGDENPQPFSYRTEKITQRQLSCYLTHTNEKTHDIIRKNLGRSPLYGGIIKGIGPRYCPSIEDKVVRFSDKKSHQVYLEPEGLETEEFYANGIPTSLPDDVQLDLVHSIKGLEHAEIMRFGYAIEYDCVPPTQLKHTLETKAVENLFLAGQINCTSGYEEAAGQGLVAGLNAVRKLRGEGPFVLDRSEAYIGVLIDDLVTKGSNEPYRMFTARAEFRLLLRQDNADERLMRYGYEFGLIEKSVHEKLKNRLKQVEDLIEKLRNMRIDSTNVAQWIKRPNNSCKHLKEKNLELGYDDLVLASVDMNLKYEGYIKKQLDDVLKMKKMEKRAIGDWVNYDLISGMRKEACEKLKKVRPDSLGHAARIPGISACDIAALSVYIEKEARRNLD